MLNYFCKKKNFLLTGIINPRMEKQSAPIKPTNGAIVGTATANSTVPATKTVLII